MAATSSSERMQNEPAGRALGRGIVRDNPFFGTFMGLCPALAVSYRVDNAVSLGAALFVILVVSAATFSLVGDRVPRRFRLTLVLLVTSCLATVAELLFRAYAPPLAARLGIYVPLIAVNCMVLAATSQSSSRAGFAGVVARATGDGIGFFIALVVISIVREALGRGSITLFQMGAFDGVLRIGGLASHPMSVVSYSAGAFLVLGYLQALAFRLLRGRERPA